jgi:O-antigen polymerase
MLGSSGLAIVLDKTIAINSGLSANARLGIYAVCIEMIKEKPIFGYGLGSFEHEFHNAKGEFQENNPNTKLISLYLTHPHNEIMFWLIEGGIIATVGLVTVLIGIILSLLVNRKVRRMSYFALLIPIGLHTQVELPFYISSIHWFTLLFLIFVVMRTEQSKFKKLMSLSMITTVKISSIITALIGVIFFVHTYVSSKEVNAMITGIDLWGLKYAPQNPYFSEVIDEMRMRSALTALYMDNKVDEIKELLPDAEEQLYRRPNPLLYVQVAMAYQKIGDEENMCRTLRDGIKIYPDEPNLQSGVTYCH